MAANPLEFILKLIKYKSRVRNAETTNPRGGNSCGLCALCGGFA